MARQSKPIHPAFFFILAVTFIGAGIIIMFIPDDGIVPSPSVILGIVFMIPSVFMLIAGFRQIGTSKNANIALRDSSTIAGQTYGALAHLSATRSS